MTNISGTKAKIFWKNTHRCVVMQEKEHDAQQWSIYLGSMKVVATFFLLFFCSFKLCIFSFIFLHCYFSCCKRQNIVFCRIEHAFWKWNNAYIRDRKNYFVFYSFSFFSQFFSIFEMRINSFEEIELEYFIATVMAEYFCFFFYIPNQRRNKDWRCLKDFFATNLSW